MPWGSRFLPVTLDEPPGLFVNDFSSLTGKAVFLIPNTRLSVVITSPGRSVEYLNLGTNFSPYLIIYSSAWRGLWKAFCILCPQTAQESQPHRNQFEKSKAPETIIFWVDLNLKRDRRNQARMSPGNFHERQILYTSSGFFVFPNYSAIDAMRFPVFFLIWATTTKQTSYLLSGNTRFFATRLKKPEEKKWNCKPSTPNETQITYTNEAFGSVTFFGIEKCVALPEDVNLNELFEDNGTEYESHKLLCYWDDVHETTISPIRVKAVKHECCQEASVMRARLQAGVLAGKN